MTDDLDKTAWDLAQKIHMDCIQAVGTTGYRWDKGTACQIIKSALLAERRRAKEWQPIQTAPRDMSNIVVWNGNEQRIAYWDTDYGCFCLPELSGEAPELV